MKRLKSIAIVSMIGLVAATGMALLTGCSTTGGGVECRSGWIQFLTVPCDIYEEVGATPENSLIAKLIENPCVAQSLLATTAKAPLVWHQERYAELFEEWAAKIQAVIDGGLTFSDLQTIVLTEIAKLNREAGMAILMVSDGIFVFDGQQSLIGDVDRRLLSMSLEDLRSQVKRMALMAS